MKHYPHHIGDFDRATRHLNRIERSVYRDMLDLYYDTEQQLPIDMEWICRKIIARSNEESTAVEQVLNEFFTETPTGWYHERCEEEIEAYRANTSQKAQAGKASAAAKALKKQQALNGNLTPVEQPLNSVGTDGYGTSTNHQPSTNQPINQSTKEVAAPRKRSEKAPAFVVPDWINAAHWSTWHSCPKRKKATNEQKQMAVDKLDAWRLAGLDYAGALENAAMGGYQGLFLPDQGPAAKPAKQPQQKTFAERDREAGWARWEEQTNRIHPDRIKAQQGQAIDVAPKPLEIAQ